MLSEPPKGQTGSRRSDVGSQRMNINRIRAGALGVLLVAAAALSGCNVWRAYSPRVHYDREAPPLPAPLRAPALLVYSKTNGFRHEEAIPAGAALFEEIATARGGSVWVTENGATFTSENLSRFSVVVFNNARSRRTARRIPRGPT